MLKSFYYFFIFLFLNLIILIKSEKTKSSSNIMTLSLFPLIPGDKINYYQLECRLDSLGIEKLFSRDHSYFGISPLNNNQFITSYYLNYNKNNEIIENNEMIRNENGENGENNENNDNKITKLNEIHVNLKDYSIKNKNYYLNKKIFLGGHGEIWLAKKILLNGNIEENTSYVLKRMYLKDRPLIFYCALREIYFGELLNLNKRIAKFITHFKLNDDYWLVFNDEGVSLQSILYALTIEDHGLPALEPSRIWKKMRTTPRGEESMKSILYQIFLGKKISFSFFFLLFCLLI